MKFGDLPLGVREIRSLFAPYVSPVDLVRLMLDEIWPLGARLTRPDGRVLPAGIIRRWEENEYIEQHQDQAQAPIYNAYGVEVLLAANVYLGVPKKGGGLMLWRTGYDREPYEQARDNEKGGLQLEYFTGEPPAITVDPSEGDLIVFGAGRIHQVERQIGGKRYTASCFIGYRGPGHPLLIWS